MNIQVFVGKKNFDTQKTERWFKERRIPFQRVDLARKGLSRGELDALVRAVGLEALIDRDAPAYRTLNMAWHGLSQEAEAMLLAHPALLKTPIVRNGRQATVGFCPDRWEAWT